MMTPSTIACGASLGTGNRILRVGILSLAALAITALWAPVLRGDDDPPAAAKAAEPAVVIELFTSQGCSSCPPADRLLARLAREGRYAGATLLPLAFHVDYWNHIGWRDPFSSAEWSGRQRAYAVALGLDTIYTPQMVLDGSRQLVGSDERALRREIRQLARRPSPLSLGLATRPMDSGALRVDASARSLPGSELPSLIGWVALYQDRLVTPVTRGENARHTLENERVVRILRPVLELVPGAAEPVSSSTVLELEAGWPRENLGLVLFVQDPGTLAIHGATAVGLAGPTRPRSDDRR